MLGEVGNDLGGPSWPGADGRMIEVAKRRVHREFSREVEHGGRDWNRTEWQVRPASSHDTTCWIGIDVQLGRGLAFAVMDSSGRVFENGWVDAVDPQGTIQELAARYPGATLGIAACALARPQWTPRADEAPPWMRFGFALFAECKRLAVRAEEVFPSAAYRMLDQDPQSRIEMPLSAFARGPKDMLDAVVAALVVREFVQGRGSAVGDGDGLGRILLPRPVEHPHLAAVSAWPGR